ncbi:BTAD domain-containing putative transcriptional regulator [Microbacterium pumilum]|uniref:OmpR/PhoB-type domain-containing protein n=1 Tax=Microbacterium pumilum TaxID=344165 RepID=A0ABP5E5N1_9MICO
MPVMVLGPLDTGTDPLSPRERAIFAALIVRRGRGVPPAELADALWGENPPATWEQQVRNSIARIRSRLGREAVTTADWEYRIGVDPESIDAVRFERLISTARQHTLHGDHDRAVDSYRKALALWRGDPLPEVSMWEPGIIEAVRLVELRTSAQEELLDARLRAGEDRSVIPEAEQLVREHPLREDRWAILALANYRANRQADALAVLRTARARLDEELGVEPGPRITELETAILRHDPLIDAPIHAPRESVSCPYPGLVPFGPDDEDTFFGREADIDAVSMRIRPGTITTIAGPSGCGKSSLLLAGVVPELRRRGRSVEVMRPGSGGVPALTRLARPQTGVDVIAIDQTEELIAAPASDIQAFSELTSAFLARDGALVLTVRSDFLDRIGALPDIGQVVGRGVYLLTGLDHVGLRAAIEGPSQLASLRLEPGLVELVLRDAADRPAVLPHLSHALVETWVRREGQTMTVDGYEASGGIAGAIARSAESAYQSMSVDEQSACRFLMRRLIERDATGASVRRRAMAAPILDDPLRLRVVETLMAARLVARDGDALIVGHEAVAQAWPRLDAWLQEDADGARLIGTVVTGAEVWDAGGRKAEDLLRGGRLQTALDWRAASGPDLTPVETEFLDASAKTHRDELVRQRRQNRRLRWVLSGAAVLLVAALVAGGVAFAQGRQAAAAAEQQRIEALAATSLSLRASDRDVAALLAAEMQRRWPEDPRARSALLGSLTAAGGLVSRLVFEEGVRASGMLIPGTRKVLMVTDHPSADPAAATPAGLAIVDIDTWTVAKEFDVDLPPLGTQFRRGVAVSGDGRIALVETPAWADPVKRTCCVNGENFIDLTTGQPLAGSHVLELRTGVFPVLSDDGSRMFTIHSISGDLIAIDTATGDVHASIPHPPDYYYGQSGLRSGISLSSDGSLLLGTDGAVKVYDPETLALTRSISVPTGYTESFIQDDGEGGLLISGYLGFGRIDEKTGDFLWRRDQQVCAEVELTGDGNLVCNAGSGTMVERSIATGEATGREYPNLSDWTQNSVAIPGAGEFLSFADRERAAVYLWRFDDEPSITTPIADGRSAVDGFGEHSSQIITAAHDENGDLVQSRLWDVAADAPIGEASDEMAWISDHVVWRRNAGGASVLEDISMQREFTLEREAGDTADYYVHSGGLGPLAFIVENERIVPIDPETGKTAAAPISFSKMELLNTLQSISEPADARRAVITWFDPDEVDTVTTVFDLETGRELSRGLKGDVQTVVTPDGDILSANAARLARSTSELKPRFALSKSGVAPKFMQVAQDGRSLMLSGVDNSVSLYDLRDGRKLGDEITTGWENPFFWPSGYLSPDGLRMVTNTKTGVLLWNLAPDRLFEAACRIAGRELTPLEWSTYFGDEQQTATCSGVLG